MTPVPIKERETLKYKMSLPDMLRVCIKTGRILVDRRHEFFMSPTVVKTDGESQD